MLGVQPESRPVRESLVVGRSIRRGPWKYIEGREPVFFSRPGSPTSPAPGEPPGQLFNLADDPRETRNLAAGNPALLAELQAEMKRIQSGSRSRP
jgi:arylsulfatase A-like enzyme